MNFFRTVLIDTCQVLLAFALLHSGVVPEQLVETTGEGEGHEKNENAESKNVMNHATERDLQWTQM